MTNNDILKKLRIALELKDTDIVDILKLADFEISKGSLGDLFRSEDHPNYVEAGDQILRNFLNGLIIYKRGPEMKREGSTPKMKSVRDIIPKIEQKLKEKSNHYNKSFSKPRGEKPFERSKDYKPSKSNYNAGSKPKDIIPKEAKPNKDKRFGDGIKPDKNSFNRNK